MLYSDSNISTILISNLSNSLSGVSVPSSHHVYLKSVPADWGLRISYPIRRRGEPFFMISEFLRWSFSDEGRQTEGEFGVGKCYTGPFLKRGYDGGSFGTFPSGATGDVTGTSSTYFHSVWTECRRRPGTRPFVGQMSPCGPEGCGDSTILPSLFPKLR